MAQTLPPPPPGVTFVGSPSEPVKRKVNPFGRPLVSAEPTTAVNLPPPPPGITFVGPAPVQRPIKASELPPPPDGVTFVGAAPDKPELEKRSAGGEFVAGVKTGAMIDLPRMVGQGLKAVAPEDSAVERFGQNLVTNADKRAEENTYDDRTRTEGFAGLAGDVGRALVPSVAVPLTVAAGALAAKVVGAGALTVGAIKGIGAVGTLALFGTSQAQDTFENIRDDMIAKGADPEQAAIQARKAGVLSGLLEGGMEGVASYFGGGKFIASVAGRIGLKTTAKTVADIAEDFAVKRTRVDIAKAFAKDLAVAYPAEMSTEFAQEGGNVLIHRAFGHEDGRDPWESALQGAKVAFGLTTLLAPLGLAGNIREAKVRNEVADAVTNGKADPVLREMAVRMITHEMSKLSGPGPAQAWGVAALKAVENNEPVDLSPSGTSKFLNNAVRIGIEERVSELREQAFNLRESGNDDGATALESQLAELEDALDADAVLDPADDVLIEESPAPEVDAALAEVNAARKRVKLPELPASVMDAFKREVAADRTAFSKDRLDAMEAGVFAPDNPEAAIVEGPGSPTEKSNSDFIQAVAAGEPIQPTVKTQTSEPVNKLQTVPTVGNESVESVQPLETNNTGPVSAAIRPAIKDVARWTAYSRSEQAVISKALEVVDRIEDSRARSGIEPLNESVRLTMINRQVQSAMGDPMAYPISQSEETRWSIGEHLNAFTGKKTKPRKKAKSADAGTEMVMVGGRGPFIVMGRTDTQATLLNPVDKTTFAADNAAMQPYRVPEQGQPELIQPSLPAAPVDVSSQVPGIPPKNTYSLTSTGAAATRLIQTEGKPAWNAVTPQDDMPASGVWDVVEASELVTSDRPEFNPDLQPRDRTTVSSREQIARIASNPDFNRLNQSATTDDGAPIVSQDRTVLSGNGRIMGLRQAYQGTAADKYRTGVQSRAAELGLSTEGMKNPVLVRVLTDTQGGDLKRFVELSNREKILQRTAAELAVADAGMLAQSGIMDLFDIGNSDNIMAASNRNFLTQFVIGTGDQSLRRSDGRFASDILKPRVERAILMAIIGQTERGRDVAVSAIERAEGLGIRPELAGIMRAGGAILNLAKSKPEFDISLNLAEAVEALIQFKQEFVDGKTSSVTGWMAQQDMFAQPIALESLIVLQGIAERGTMSGVFEFLNDYVNQARAVDTSTIDLFADLPSSTSEDMLRRARNRAKQTIENELGVRLATVTAESSSGNEGQSGPVVEGAGRPDNQGGEVNAPLQQGGKGSLGDNDNGGPVAAPPGNRERGTDVPGSTTVRKRVNPFGKPRTTEQPVSGTDANAGGSVPGSQRKTRPTGMGKPARTAGSTGTGNQTVSPDGNVVVERSSGIPVDPEGSALASVVGPSGSQPVIADQELSAAVIDAQADAVASMDRTNELRVKLVGVLRNLETAYDRRERITVNSMLPAAKARADLENRRSNVVSTINDLETERGSVERELAGAVGVEQVATAKAEVAKDGVRAVADGVADAAAVKESLKSQVLDDFGEKIGGARKDLAERGYSRVPKREAVKDGQPSWKKRYKAAESVIVPGTWSIIDTKSRYGGGFRQSFNSEADANAAIPLFAVAQSHRVQQEKDKTFSIFKVVSDRKQVRVVNQNFPSREDAMKYMAQNAEALLNQKITFGEEILPTPELARREGKAYREGDATPELFMKTFAPRGIEFGNWNNQDERQMVMNHAYDALMDMSDVLRVTSKALMLNGELAIAFGARGQGLSGAKAHYESDHAVINLTKMSGAGSLAHEWMHAFDNYLARLDGKSSSEKQQSESGGMVYKDGTRRINYQSHGYSYNSKMREELRTKYNNLVKMLFTKSEQYVEDTELAERFLGKTRDYLAENIAKARSQLTSDTTQYRKGKFAKPAPEELLAEFDRVSAALLEGGNLELKWVKNPNSKTKYGSYYWSNDTLDQLSKVFKAGKNITGFSSESKGALDMVAAAMKSYSARIKMFVDAKEGTNKSKSVPTRFAIEAKKMDQARTSDYWTEPHEMIARAFSSYVEDKTAAQGGVSEFLVYRAHGGIILPMIDGFVARPYPEGDERTLINSAFEDLFSTIKTKETENGNVALFSVAGGAVVTAEQDAAYLAAVESGDTATAQKMVDEAAKAAGYTVGPVYHGGNFNANVDPVWKEINGQGYGWFTPSLEKAETYADGDGRTVTAAYLKLNNPAKFHQWSGRGTLGLEVQGYDGVANEDMMFVTSPSQIKSADPITRDDQGNVIPLSRRFNAESADIRFSNDAAVPFAPIPVELAQAAVAPVMSLIPAGVAEVVASIESLPASDRALLDSSRRAQGVTGRIRAVTMPSGKIYVFADGVRSEADAVSALVHEVFERGVLSAMDRAGVDAFLKSIMDGRLEKNGIYKAARDRVARNYPGLDTNTDAGRTAFATEVLAHIAENRKRLPTLWNRIVRAVRQFMARLVEGTRLDGYFGEITDPELEGFIDQMLERGATLPGVAVAVEKEARMSATGKVISLYRGSDFETRDTTKSNAGGVSLLGVSYSDSELVAKSFGSNIQPETVSVGRINR